MKSVERAKLEIFVREIQDALATATPVVSVKEVLDTWITANSLRPDKVQSLSQREFKELLKEGVVVDGTGGAL